jgi:hypothetical protein
MLVLAGTALEGTERHSNRVGSGFNCKNNTRLEMLDEGEHTRALGSSSLTKKKVL